MAISEKYIPLYRSLSRRILAITVITTSIVAILVMVFSTFRMVPYLTLAIIILGLLVIYKMSYRAIRHETASLRLLTRTTDEMAEERVPPLTALLLKFLKAIFSITRV